MTDNIESRAGTLVRRAEWEQIKPGLEDAAYRLSASDSGTGIERRAVAHDVVRAIQAHKAHDVLYIDLATFKRNRYESVGADGAYGPSTMKGIMARLRKQLADLPEANWDGLRLDFTPWGKFRSQTQFLFAEVPASLEDVPNETYILIWSVPRRIEPTIDETRPEPPGVDALVNRLNGMLHTIANELSEQSTPQRLLLVENLLEVAKTELDGILDESYTVELQREHGYLQRAESLFMNATQFYAVSLDGISTFWTDEISQQYFDAQRPTCPVRLFVYDTPDRLHATRQMLNRHHEEYGQSERGAVLVCSTTAYQRYLTEHGLLTAESLHRDFGLWFYKGTHGMKVELAQGIARFTALGANWRDTQPELTLFTKTADKARELLQPGNCAAQPINGLHCGRWDTRFADDRNRDRLRRFLSELFPDYRRQGEAAHMLFLSIPPGTDHDLKRDKLRRAHLTLRRALAERMEALEARLGRVDVWFGSKRGSSEALTRARLQAEPDGPNQYVLIMKFKDSKALDDFYDTPELRQVRDDSYRDLDPSFGKLLDVLSIVDKTNPECGDQIREAIEGLATLYVTRRDYVDNMSIDERFGE